MFVYIVLDIAYITMGNKNGVHKIIYKNGDVYEGNLVNGIKNGFGKLMCANDGDTYDGHWLNDKFDGYGEFKNSNSTYIYKGEFKNGYKHGKGKIIFANGDTFSGLFEFYMKHGFCTLTNSGNIYECIFQYNKLDGHCKATINIVSGFGTYVFPNKSTYRGRFKNSMFHGKGTFIGIDDSKYIGNMKNNKMHGEGKLTFGNELIYEGIFHENKFGDIQFIFKYGLIYEEPRTNQNNNSDDSKKIIPNDDLDDINQCCICMENPKECAFNNCGHLCLCINCAKNIHNTKKNVCPICRTSGRIIRIFL